MTTSKRTRSQKLGLPPGSLVHVGKTSEQKVTLALTAFDAERFEENPDADFGLFEASLQKPGVTWLDVRGLQDVDLIRRLGDLLKIHPLVLEDLLNTQQRPKAEPHEGYLFVVAKMPRRATPQGQREEEQVSLLLGKNWLVTLRERAQDPFEPVRERLRNARGKLRSSGPDFLLHAVLDVLVDSYFVELEAVSEAVESTEEELLLKPVPKTLERVHNLRREVTALRRSVWPLREAIQNITREDGGLISPSVLPYFHDIRDHLVQVVESAEQHREELSEHVDIYLSAVSYKMNEVMKVLTVIATFFIPLTFLVGVYGMNFEFMPELRWRYGYFTLWAFMLAVAGGMVIYFRKKRWF
jgi:magnesium transporter